MKQQHAKSWRLRHRRGFTLIEVVASLILLGTLLVGILAAHRRHAEQVVRARKRIEAIAAADALLANWREQGLWGADQPAGRIPNTTFTWRWQVTRPAELRRVGAQVGRLEIIDPSTPGVTTLASVEVLLQDTVAMPSASLNTQP